MQLKKDICDNYEITWCEIDFFKRELELRCKNMKNFKAIILVMIALAGAPLTSHGQAGSAAGGMSVGTAVAIGVVGAALLVALGDSSSSSPTPVTPQDSSGQASASTTPAQTINTTTTTTTTTTL